MNEMVGERTCSGNGCEVGVAKYEVGVAIISNEIWRK